MTHDDIFQVLRFDHDRHRALMEQIRATEGASAERKALFDEFVRDTEAHASGEELVFYSRLLEDPDAREKSAHSIEEHQRIRDELRELAGTDMSSSGWLQRFAKVCETFEHHMKEEEQGVFQMAGRVLGEKEKRDLVTAFRDAKLGEKIS